MKKQEIIKKLEKLTPRSAWSRAVVSDAMDLVVENLTCSEIPNSWQELEKELLNGAADWSKYSYGGCALVYNGDIVKHYCTPSELRRATRKGGNIAERANAQENWLDVQARALRQAALLIKEAAGL